MNVALIMFRDDGDHRPFNVTKAVTTIGRREDCDLRIAVGDVSRKHCKLTVDDDAMRVEDLGSSNGTFVNGTRVVKAAPVAAGDVLKVGPVTFVVQVDGEPNASTVDERVRGTAAAKAEKRPAAPSPKKAAAIDGDIDEMSILNDSSGGSGIEINLSDDSNG